MPEQKHSREEELRRILRERGDRMPATVVTLVRAVLNEPDGEITHDDCRETFDERVDTVLEGGQIAEQSPAVRRHLAMCDECAKEYADLMDLTRKELAGLIPIPADIPAPDLSFLPGAKPSPPIDQWVEQLLKTMERQLKHLIVSPNVALAPAYALDVRPEIEEGQTKDGTVHWKILEDKEKNLTIQVRSQWTPLEGVRLRLEAGHWAREVVLTRLSPDDLGADILLPRQERPRDVEEQGVPLTLDFIGPP